MLEQLRYVRLPTSDLAKTKEFAAQYIGLELSEEGAEFARFRSDEKAFALEYDASGATITPVIGLEVSGQEQLSEAQKQLESIDVNVEVMSCETCAHLRMKNGIAFSDFSDNRFEVGVRHEIKGRRYFPARDAGISGFSSVSLRSTDIDRDNEIWSNIFGAEVRDFIGQSVYIGFDDQHHRLSLHPSKEGGLLQLSFEVEDLDNIMQSYYFLGEHQVRILHGPGKLPSSGETFVTFEGPDRIAYRYSCAMERVQPGRRPRQFGETPVSYCTWGSQSLIPELSGGAK